MKTFLIPSLPPAAPTPIFNLTLLIISALQISVARTIVLVRTITIWVFTLHRLMILFNPNFQFNLFLITAILIAQVCHTDNTISNCQKKKIKSEWSGTLKYSPFHVALLFSIWPDFYFEQIVFPLPFSLQFTLFHDILERLSFFSSCILFLKCVEFHG